MIYIVTFAQFDTQKPRANDLIPDVKLVTRDKKEAESKLFELKLCYIYGDLEIEFEYPGKTISYTDSCHRYGYIRITHIDEEAWNVND